MVSCLMGDSTALASAIVRCCPIEQLHLSVRASNVLHRMGIHTFEELIDTPVSYTHLTLPTILLV